MQKTDSRAVKPRLGKRNKTKQDTKMRNPPLNLGLDI